MQTIICRSGYRSVYGKLTKWAPEASVFIWRYLQVA